MAGQDSTRPQMTFNWPTITFEFVNGCSGVECRSIMVACLLALHSQPSNPDMNVQLASSQCTIQLATIKARASLVRTTGATSAEQANAVVFVRAAAVVVMAMVNASNHTSFKVIQSNRNGGPRVHDA